MSQDAAEAGRTEDDSGELDEVEEALDGTGLTEDDLEEVSKPEDSSENFEGVLSYEGDFLYVGSGGGAFRDGVDEDLNMATLDPRARGRHGQPLYGGNPADHSDVNAAIADAEMSGVTYVIDDSLAEVLSYNDWETEVDPGAAVREAREWALELLKVGELSGIVVSNGVDGEHAAPVDFRMGERYNGPEDDVVPSAVLDTFANTLKMNGWKEEYSDVGDDRAELYLVP